MLFDFPLDEDFTLKIGAHSWHIIFIDIMSELQDNGHLWGLCVPEKETIYINRNASYSMKLSTLFHELLHALEAVYDINIEHKDLNLVGDALAQIFIDSFKQKKNKKG